MEKVSQFMYKRPIGDEDKVFSTLQGILHIDCYAVNIVYSGFHPTTVSSRINRIYCRGQDEHLS